MQLTNNWGHGEDILHQRKDGRGGRLVLTESFGLRSSVGLARLDRWMGR